MIAPIVLVLVRHRQNTAFSGVIHSLFAGVPIGVLLVERIVATVYCSGDSIVEFLTTTPLFVNKTILAPVSGTVNQWFITLSWVPTADQRGPQVSCFVHSLSRSERSMYSPSWARCSVLLPLIKEA